MKKVFKRLFHNDSWTNTATNLGVSNSRTSNTVYSQSRGLHQSTLKQMYSHDGISKRIVDCVVADALKGFINAEDELLDEMKRIGAANAIFTAGRAGRLYGGALLVAFVDDGQDLTQPLNLKRVHKIASLKAYDRHQVSFEDKDICNDIYSEHLGQPEIYKIKQKQKSYEVGSDSFSVHRSRCFNFSGDSSLEESDHWGDSVLQVCFNAIRNQGIIQGTSVEIVQDFVQPILKMQGLDSKASAGEIESIRERLNIIDRSRSTQNTIVLDSESGEEYSKLPSNVTGLSDLWNQFSEAICSATGIPASRLYGKSPSGLNASGESDQDNWHDIVESYRVDQIESCLNWLIEIQQNQQAWKNKPSSFDWTFPTLHNPSETELASIRKIYTDIDAIYIDRGGISASEAWQARFGQNEFKRDIKLKKLDDDDEGEDDYMQQENTVEKEAVKSAQSP